MSSVTQALVSPNWLMPSMRSDLPGSSERVSAGRYFANYKKSQPGDRIAHSGSVPKKLLRFHNSGTSGITSLAERASICRQKILNEKTHHTPKEGPAENCDSTALRFATNSARLEVLAISPLFARN